MNVSQRIENIQDQMFDATITVTDIPKGHFMAITSNSIQAGSTTREIGIDIMPLEPAPGGTSTVSTNMITRASGETAIKVTVSKDGQEHGTNTTNYPS